MWVPCFVIFGEERSRRGHTTTKMFFGIRMVQRILINLEGVTMGFKRITLVAAIGGLLFEAGWVTIFLLDGIFLGLFCLTAAIVLWFIASNWEGKYIHDEA